MTSQTSVSIILVNYNTSEEIDNCLTSIFKLSFTFNIEIIVLDNNSPDRSIETLIPKYHGVKFILLKDNYGFSAANNTGISNSQSDYVLFVNPDVVFIEDCITPILDFFKSDTKAGICGPMLLNSDFSYQCSSGFRMGIFYEFLEASFLISLVRKAAYIFRYKNLSHQIKTGWVSAACMLVKKDFLNSMGGFDESYFMNYEDIDLCKKAYDNRYGVYYFPYLKCIHKGLASQSKDFEKLVFNRYKSRLIYAGNHYSVIKRFIVRVIHIAGLLTRISILFVFKINPEMEQRFRGYVNSLKLYLKR